MRYRFVLPREARVRLLIMTLLIVVTGLTLYWVAFDQQKKETGYIQSTALAEQDRRDLADQVEPALVTIRNQYNGPPGDSWPHQKAHRIGTGMIVSADGLVLTSLQAAPEEGLQYYAVLHSGESVELTEVYRDDVFGVVAFQLDRLDLPTVVLDPEVPLPGSDVLAIGNRVGDKHSLREIGQVIATGRQAGVVYDRYIPNLEKEAEIGTPTTAEEAIAVQGEWVTERKTYHNVILTSLPTSYGYAGGPLLSKTGAVSGMLFAPDQDRLFAIGAVELSYLVDSIAQYGRVIHADLGLREYVIGSRLEEGGQFLYGALLSSDSFFEDSPVYAAGLRVHDRILQVAGHDVTQDWPLERILRNYRPGHLVEVEFLQPLGDIRRAEVTLADRLLLDGEATDLLCVFDEL